MRDQRCIFVAMRCTSHPIRVGSPRDLRSFWRRVEKTDGCWFWRGKIKSTGYGIVQRARKAIHAHRYAYELIVGPIPDGLYICHHCDVRACVNPAHLFPATQRENILDMVSKGRHASQVAGTPAHCKHGHAFTPENTYRKPNGTHACKMCVRDRGVEYRERLARNAKKEAIA
jgi:hypothetical protein